MAPDSCRALDPQPFAHLHAGPVPLAGLPKPLVLELDAKTVTCKITGR
jgi:hypothetical protein